MRPDIADWLVCPVTKEPLRREARTLVSATQRYHYSDEGFWDMTPYSLQELAQPVWKTWQHLQDNGVESYKHDPSKNLGVGPRKDHLAFKDFVGFKGRILDVGVGPQAAPSHVEYSTEKELEGFVGIDPLAGETPKKYNFVKGLGEYLPFRDNFFDKVMFVTSLDHFVSPFSALESAKRVLAANGEICVWMGEKSKNAPKPAVSAGWYESLSVPEGAEDRFHLKRFGWQDFQSMAVQAGLRMSDHSEIKVDEWRTNHFVKLKK